MILRRFNELGLQRMEKFIDSFKSDVPDVFPLPLLSDGTASEPVEPEIEITRTSFSSRFDFAEYFYDRAVKSGLDRFEKDAGMWAWLSLCMFDSLCPADGNGRRKPGARERWLLSDRYNRYYRHLLAGPFGAYRAHRDDPYRALALLCGPLDKPGEIYEQLASRLERISNAAVIGAATQLYVNLASSTPRRGGAGSGPGSARRFAIVLSQLDLTWDLYSLTADALIDLLPHEFDRFKQPSVR